MTIDRYPIRDGMIGYIRKFNGVYAEIVLNSSYYNICHSIYYPLKSIKLVYQLEFEWL